MWEQGAAAMLLGDVARAREVRDLLAPFAHDDVVTSIRATCIYGPRRRSPGPAGRVPGGAGTARG